MAEWRQRKLGELVAIEHGFAFKGEYFSDEAGAGPVLLTPGNFAVGGGFRQAKGKYYTGDVPDGYVLRHGDLIVTMTDLSKAADTLGNIARVPGDATYLHNQRIGLVRVLEPEALDENFLHYALRASEYRHHIVSGATGSTVKHTSPSRICEYTMKLPSRGEQRAIAEVLGALDDKIAVNERIVATSDLLAQTSYHGAALDEPEEFSDQPLSTAAEFINGRAFTKGATGTGRMVVRIAEINSGPGSSTVYNDIEVPDQHLARPGDLLFAWSGSLTAARWYRPEAIVNQHIFKVVPRDGRPMWLAAALVQLKLERFRAIAADKATTMGHIQRRHLDEPVLTPSVAMTQKLGARLGPLWDRALAAEQESLALAALRDALLPQLMSGKFRVRDAERIVEDAV